MECIEGRVEEWRRTRCGQRPRRQLRKQDYIHLGQEPASHKASMVINGPFVTGTGWPGAVWLNVLMCCVVRAGSTRTRFSTLRVAVRSAFQRASRGLQWLAEAGRPAADFDLMSFFQGVIRRRNREMGVLGYASSKNDSKRSGSPGLDPLT